MLIKQIRTDLTTATKARDTVRMRTLRSVIAAVQEAEVSGDEAVTLDDDGVLVVIKAQEHRSLPMNRAAALARLQAMVDEVAEPPRARRATKPTWGSQQRRLEGKSVRSRVKSLRGKPLWDNVMIDAPLKD